MVVLAGGTGGAKLARGMADVVGPERLVTGSDGSAYYTDDHYKTFKKIR